MVTIKDIARAALVSQGTVSNVLNGKGNVSSEKIRHVMEAAASLGYVPNERAKLLRKGHSNTLSVILPNIQFKQYSDFYLSFKTYAENHGFSVALYLTNDDSSESESAAIQEIKSSMAAGIATISNCDFTMENSSYHTENGQIMDHLVFVERRPCFETGCIGFDYEKAGADLAARAIKDQYTNICLLTGSLLFSNEEEFYNGFMKKLGHASCLVNHVQTDAHRMLQNIIQMFNSTTPQAVYISNYGFAESVKDICNTFYAAADLPIYTISPLFTMPENDFQKYELNYRQLGKVAAEKLIRSIRTSIAVSSCTLENSGFRNWFANIIPTLAKEPLNILTLDTPTAYAMRTLSQLYTKKTGTDVNITIYSYDEIYEAFNSLNEDSVFDILRLDVTWLSWFAEKILQPLDAIDSKISSCFGDFLDGTINQYSMVNGHVYALPSTPSAQILFYRKDLFQSPIYRRMYLEKYKKELKPPMTFEEFNQIACFFTKTFNPESPVDYGATLTLGSTGVAGSEFLARFFSCQDHLYNSSFQVVLNSPNAVTSLEQLIEIQEYSNPSYCAWWTNTATAFAEGNVAMAILYSNYASDLLSHSSKVVGNIGFAMVPGNNPVIGGGSLGVSKYSKRPKEALSFIKWLSSEPISSASTLLGSVSPCRKSYINYEIINHYPWLNLAKNCFAIAKGQRTPKFSNTPFDEGRFLSIIGMAVKNAYSKAQTPIQALNLAQRMYEEQFPSL